VGRATRPSSAQLRGALASIWADRVSGARVLDLFAGSGAVGLELLSRGAAHAVFVESDRGALKALARNLELSSPERSRRFALDASRALKKLAEEGERFDLLFVDPPYEQPLGARLFAGLAAVAAPEAQLAVERRVREPLPAGSPWRALGARRYGDAALHLFELERVAPTAANES
jgi:16S rRNA (guanine966-N2)-methyltransferase